MRLIIGLFLAAQLIWLSWRYIVASTEKATLRRFLRRELPISTVIATVLVVLLHLQANLTLKLF